jgi:surface antigen
MKVLGLGLVAVAMLLMLGGADLLPAHAASNGCSTIVVQRGDTLAKLASRYHTTVATLARDNHIGQPNYIVPGERLALCAIPAGASGNRNGYKPRGWRNTFPYGQCTWYAAQEFDRDTDHFGNAKLWIISARAHGYPTGTTPKVGAVAVFQPGHSGAGGLGHVAIVTWVGPLGTFGIREMNRSGVPAWDYRTGRWSFGGIGQVDNWFAHTGPGVSFIYA